MKGASPILAGLLLLVGAAGLLRLAGTQNAVEQAKSLGEIMAYQSLGVRDIRQQPVETSPSPSPAPSPEGVPSPLPSPSETPVPVPVETVEEAWDERHRQSQPEEDQTAPPESIQLPTEVPSLEMRNNTDYEIDFTALPPLPEDLELQSEDPVVLIVHTHTTESYLDPAEDPETSVYRSREETEGVMAVGDVMAACLEDRGYSVLHDKTLCDYPEYNGAYNRSRAVIEADLAAYPSICLVIDLHRDAVADQDGSQLRLAANIDGEAVAQVMLVVGTDDGGLTHPNWQTNFSLAAVLQTAIQETSPGMMRPINLRAERFNQDLGPLALLVEVGTSGNTQEEANRAGERFARGLADVFDALQGKNP